MKMTPMFEIIAALLLMSIPRDTRALVAEQDNGDCTASHTVRELAVGLSRHRDITRLDRAPSTQTHDVIFAVRRKNVDKLEEILLDISDPTSVNYGNHMTAREIADLTGCSDSRDAVIAHLEKTGARIVDQSLEGAFITARAPVSLWEDLFDAEFHTYSVLTTQVSEEGVSSDGRRILKNYVRAEQYSLPIDLDAHVDSVFNTIQMPPLVLTTTTTPMKRKLNAHVGLSFIDSSVSMIPSKLKEAYNVDSTLGHPLATQAVFETMSQYFSPEDLKDFQLTFAVPEMSVNTSFGNHSMSSAECQVETNVTSCHQGNVDLQYLLAMSQGRTTYYSSEESWIGFLMDLVQHPNPPLVVSISYGSDEIDISSGEADNFNFLAMALAARGLTLVVASGDDGAVSAGARSDAAQCSYSPRFPTTNPYVLSVGASMVSYYVNDATRRDCVVTVIWLFHFCYHSRV